MKSCALGMQMWVEKLLKVISTKKQDIGYLWQGEREGHRKVFWGAANLLVLVLGDEYTRVHFELLLTVHRYLLTILKVSFHNSKKRQGTSLVAQWIRIHLPMQGTRVRAMVQEDPTCRGATRPVGHNYWACALEPTSHNYWAHVPHYWSPCT